MEPDAVVNATVSFWLVTRHVPVSLDRLITELLINAEILNVNPLIISPT